MGEKGHEVEPANLSVFRILVSSRYGKTRELIEMMRFAEAAAGAAVAHHVKSLFYDSAAGLCTIDVDVAVTRYSEVEDEILRIAKQTLSQFNWHDGIEHGGQRDNTLD